MFFLPLLVTPCIMRGHAGRWFVMKLSPPLTPCSDMVLSVSSSTGSPGEYKSSDDSMQNVSDSSEVSHTHT